MIKKNLIFLALLIGFVLMISVVSAGITGYFLSRGQLVPGTSTQIESVNVQTSSIVVDGEKVSAGETFTRGSKTYKVEAVEKPFFWSRPKVEIQEVTPSAKSGTGNSEILSVTEEECSENCRTFTDVYKLEEGQVISINGNTISIDFINANQIKLDVNGQITSLLNEGNTFELSDGKIVVVKNVVKLEVAGEIGWVELGVLSSYKLKEGQQISIVGNVISIDFINANQVMLDVNGQITSLLNEGNTFNLNNGQIVTIQDVAKLEVAGEIGWVVLDPSSCYFPYL